MTAALNDVRIFELGHVIAGPLVAALLVDSGAQVIKLEHPEGGDMIRELGPKAVDGAGVWWTRLARRRPKRGARFCGNWSVPRMC